MKDVYLMMGLPGAGKSYYCQNNFDLTDPSVMRINADAIRAMLYMDETIQGNGKRVFQIVNELFRSALSSVLVKTIIIDNTNVDLRSRQPFYDMIQDKGIAAKITLIVFSDHNVAYTRNQSRERYVPEHVLDSMKNRFYISEFEYDNYTVKYT